MGAGQSGESLPQPVPERGTSLYSGQEMSGAELAAVTFAHPTNLILIMGEPNSGKTTLLAALFDVFQKGPFSRHLFAGSRTQIGFEIRCHTARMASGRVQPDTERTTNDEFSYLHLALRKSDLVHPAQHLLFTDVSGERFRQARDYQEEMQRLTILKHADHIFYVVNGDHLSDLAKRQSAKANVIKLLNRAQQANMVAPGSKIILLINKWDVVVHRGMETKVATFFEQPMLDLFPAILQRIDKVVARAKYATVLPAHFGLDAFLSVCVTRQVVAPPPGAPLDAAPVKREFYRLESLYPSVG